MIYINTNSKTLVLLQGLPGSGKSTFVKRNGLEKFTLCKDEFRIKAGCDTADGIGQDSNGIVRRIVYMLLEERLRHGKFTVIDETCVHENTISKYREYASKYDFQVVLLRFDADVDDLIRANEGRGFRSVPEKQLRKLRGLLMSNPYTAIDYRCVSITHSEEEDAA